MNRLIRYGFKGIALLLALVILSAPFLTFAQEQAKDVTRACVFSFSDGSDSKKLSRLKDKQLTTVVSLSKNKEMKIRLKDSGARYLCIAWKNEESDRYIKVYDEDKNLLDERIDPYKGYHETYELPSQASYILIGTGERESLDIVELYLFGEGELPDPWFYQWEDTPDSLDFLIISTHPDDDCLYLGAIMPIYGAEQGYTGTILYITSPDRERVTEALMGAWTMGTRYSPLFAGFPDVAKETSSKAYLFTYELVLSSLVRYYRAYKPLVIFTQDVKGEYGHWQHVLTTQCALDAMDKAADPNYDPESAAALGTWQVLKCYTHMYQGEKLPLDTRMPLESFEGLNAFEIAQAAYKKHKSQTSSTRFAVSDTSDRSIADMGLAKCYVEDPGQDAFDGIAQELLGGKRYEPTPEPTVTPTQEPTEAPTNTPKLTLPPSPDNGETQSPTELPALTASAAVETEPPKVGTASSRHETSGFMLLPIALAAVLVLLVALVCVQVHKERKRKKRKRRKKHKQ